MQPNEHRRLRFQTVHLSVRNAWCLQLSPASHPENYRLPELSRPRNDTAQRMAPDRHRCRARFLQSSEASQDLLSKTCSERAPGLANQCNVDHTPPGQTPKEPDTVLLSNSPSIATLS